MKAYNSPTDELHIKSNSGEELVKITPNETKIKNMDLSSLGIESTPEEIDAAVAKADSIPAVTVADAGKVLGVTEEGKIAPVESESSNLISSNPPYDLEINDSIYSALMGETTVAYTINMPTEKLKPESDKIPSFITLKHGTNQFIILNLVQISGRYLGEYSATFSVLGGKIKLIYLKVDVPGDTTCQCMLLSRLVAQG